jgi:multicomponent Na+:H+ antiporter subunit E
MSSIVSERKSKSREVSSEVASHVASASALVSPAAPEHVAPPSTAPAPVVRSPLRAVSVWVTLLVFWLLLSGMYTPFLLAAGAVAAAAVTAIALRMGLIDREGHPIDLGIRAFCWYWPWLVKEIVKSAWQVTRIILHPKLPISPRVVRFEPSQKSDLGLVIHANSITLTPGTICIEATRGEFLVHALTADGAESQVTGNDMDRRVASLEGR